MIGHALADIYRDDNDLNVVRCECGWESASWRQRANATGEFDAHMASHAEDRRPITDLAAVAAIESAGVVVRESLGALGVDSSNEEHMRIVRATAYVMGTLTPRQTDTFLLCIAQPSTT